MPRLTTSIAPALISVFLAASALSPPAAAQAAWTWPLRGEVITPYRNGDDPYAAGQHRGIDIAGSVGAPVVAAAAGEVRFAGVAGSSGLTVSVRTDDGFDTSYLHLSSAAVRAGERVSAGERLGGVGISGTRSASEPHLHFGVREAGTRHAYRDPLDFLPAPEAPPGARPAPAPQPVPVTPAPLAAPVPSVTPRAAPLELPRRLPAARRAPAGGPVPSLAPSRAPVGGGARAPVVAVPSPAGRLSLPARRSGVGSAPSPAARPRHAAEARPEGAGVHRVATAVQSPRVLEHSEPASRSAATAAAGGGAGRGAEPGGRTGPDVGMLLACVGVLMAAAVLGLTDGGRAAAGRGTVGLRRALRPLFGTR